MEKNLDAEPSRFEGIVPGKYVLLFDLDGTLVSYNKKQRLEWSFPDYVKNWLTNNRGTKITIISNQKNYNSQMEEKIKNILTELRKHLIVDIYISTSDGWYRKPSPKIFVDCILKPNQSYLYIGDAAGRSGDFSDSDRLFAYNSDVVAKTVNSSVKFRTPEKFFLNEPQKLPKIASIFSKKNDNGTDIKKVVERLLKFPKNVVIMCGPPGSGKSYFSDYLICELEVSDSINAEKNSIIVTRDKEKVHTVDTKIFILSGKLTINKVNEISQNDLIIWDTTGYTKEIRGEVIRKFSQHEPTIIWLQTTEKERKWLRFYRTIETNLTIPDIAIRIQDKKFEEPSFEELPGKNEDGIIIINTFDTIDSQSLGLEGKFLC
jgi:DNA 3'-phosphatase